MLVVDTASPVPPFEQLRLQLIAQIERGELPPGTQLPTVRRLAADLGLAPNTVARTYRELEQAGLVRTAGRRASWPSRPLTSVRTPPISLRLRSTHAGPRSEPRRGPEPRSPGPRQLTSAVPM